MKVIIIGGVAAGASAAARLRRLDETAQIIVLERSGYVSYANCALPYYVGGVIENQDALTLQTPERFQNRFQIDVRIRQEAVEIHRAARRLTIRRLEDDSLYEESYDALVLCPGAKPVVPDLPGMDLLGVYTLRTVEDALRLHSVLSQNHPSSALIAGGGFIGLEMAENLRNQGLSVTLIEKAPQVMPPLDADMAALVRNRLLKAGVNLRLNAGLAAIHPEAEGLQAVLENGEILSCDLVILAIGVLPDTSLARAAGLTLGLKGAIVVDEQLRTSDPAIYAAGDAVQIVNLSTGKPALISLAGPANRQGRMVADSICGRHVSYSGARAASVVKLFDMTIASAGLNERSAREAGIEFESVLLSAASSHASYYPGAENMVLKALFEKKEGILLGAQIVGGAGVDKRIDVLAAALHARMTSKDLSALNLSYAPPYSSAKDPVNIAGCVMENLREGLFRQWRLEDLSSIRLNPNAVLLDVSTPGEYTSGHLEGSVNIPLDALRARLTELSPEKIYYLNCQSGLRSYLACRILSQHGISCLNLSGGYRFYQLIKAPETVSSPAVAPCGLPLSASCASASALSAEEIKRVKGLGFLHRKGTDAFNARVITRNGKVTADEMAAVVDAARQYGNGEIALTSRMTLEVQAIPFHQIDAFRARLAQAGLATGGTGNKVRPVVSCKGTTCQYGLIDTFALSEKIHERFYEGYHDVLLPHKFKIAVGGCPNNCVKPDLNDLGIIGQHAPVLDPALCRGCKKCAVEQACPLRACSVENGTLSFGERCNRCGRCIGKCPFGAVTGKTCGYKVTIGGRWGKRVAQGRALNALLTTEDDVLNVVEKALLLFRSQGISGERFADTMERLGFDTVEKLLLQNDLLERKDEILGADIQSGKP